MTNEEQGRLQQAESGVRWRRWGPYLSERQWGTVREDPGQDPGNTWAAFPYDQAGYRAYRWGEDGLAGICDDKQRLCLSVALWNERDPTLKERLFGLTNSQGNHGEDVKECYYYLDATPTSSYLKMLYKYPQGEFPYNDLIATNGARSKTEPEYELIDTGIFNDNRYFDVFVEYAKDSPEDLLMQVTVHNRGPEEARLHVLPTLWFRHTWSWAGGDEQPSLHVDNDVQGMSAVVAQQSDLGVRWFYADQQVPVLVTGNETNNERVFGSPNDSPYVKDGIERAVVHGEQRQGQPRRQRDQGGHALRDGGSGRGQRDDPDAADRHAVRAPLRRLRRGDGRPPRRGGRVLRERAGRGADRRRAPGQPSGAGRHALVEAVLRARHGAVADRARLRPDRAGRGAAQSRLAAPDLRGHHLDARQVGVPVVRGLGSRLPRDRPLGRRHAVRQAAAPAAARPPLPAPERAAAGLRVELQRRQPAGARLGHLVRLLDGEGQNRPGRPRLPRRRVPEADAELRLVAEPQGRRRPQHLPGRVPRP